MVHAKWIADPAHSEIQFRVKHLMITTVTGHFKQYDLEVETENDDFTKASKILFTANIHSIDTNNAQRDLHLKSADFFAAGKFPQMKFIGKKIEQEKDQYLLQGELTIRDITKPITLEVDFAGIITDPWGQTRAGFTADGKIKRKEFNLAWNTITEAGYVVVSDDVRIHAEIQLVKQEEEETLVEEEVMHEIQM